MMTREEYERRKRRLEEQLAEGVELLRAGFRQQIRALELVWMTTAAEDVALASIPAAETRREEPSGSVQASATPQPAKPSRRPRQPTGKLWDDVDAAFHRLPQVFDRNDLLKALGYEPERSSLYRVVQAYLREGLIVLHTRPAGKIPAKYEKSEADGESGEDSGETESPAS